MQAIVTIARLELIQIFGSKRYILIILFSLLPCLLSIAIKGDFKLYEESPYDLGVVFFLYLTYPQFICLMLAVLYGTSLIQREIDHKTINYLFTRPVSKLRVYTGKYLGSVTGLTLLTGLSLILTWLISFQRCSISVLFIFFISLFLCYAVYVALFSIVGILFPTRALAIGIMYGFTVELFFSLMPANINRISVIYYLRSFIWTSVSKDPSVSGFIKNNQLDIIIGNIGPLQSLFIIMLISLSLVVVASTILTLKEHNVTEKV